MKRLFRIFLSENSGQDLVEYTLLVAFVGLAGAGLFLGSGASMGQAWSSANSVLTAGADPAGGGSQGGGSQSGGDQGGGDHGGDHGGGDHGGDGGGH